MFRLRAASALLIVCSAGVTCLAFQAQPQDKTRPPAPAKAGTPKAVPRSPLSEVVGQVRAGHYQEAAVTLEAAIHTDPKGGENLYLLLSECYAQLADPAKAAVTLRAGLRAYPAAPVLERALASGTGTSRIAPVVDLAGNPRDWTQIPGATGPMQSFSVFGDALNPGDPFRRQVDRTGYITRLLGFMPRANAFNGGPNCTAAVPCDGLNTAIHRWARRTVVGPAGGTGQNVDAYRRKQFNIKIDHNFNTNHRLTGTWIRESHFSDNNQLSPWPQGFGGEITEYPRVTTAQLTSTLSPTLLNEFRFGYRRTTLHFTPPYHASKHGKEAYDFLPQINGYPTILTPTLIGAAMVSGLYTATRAPCIPTRTH